jgi:tetratricopeptide (TPR) repeat protein
VLAAYAEGTLDAQEKQDLERHIANCAECPAVVAETVRFLGSRENDIRTDSTWPFWSLAAAATLALISVTGILRFLSTRDQLHRLRTIAAASPTRPIEGKLDRFPHAHYSRPRSKASWTGSPELRAEAERIAERGGHDAECLHARGIAALTLGDTRAAAALIAAATRSKPEEARYWSDLAATRIASATGPAHDRILEEALAAADRATALSPSSAAAHFNRGVALEHLGRNAAAVSAYREALAREQAPEWRQEMQGHIDRLTTR